MKITASQLRENVYSLLDEVIETGKPIEIERKGVTLRIVADQKTYQKLSRLKKRKASDEDSENFSHVDWSKEWKSK